MKFRFCSTQPLASIGIAVFALCLATSLEAQQNLVPTQPDRPWELVASLGGPLGGPSEGVEQAMRASGWDHDSDLFAQQHPSSSSLGRISLAISLRRGLGPHSEVEMMVSHSATGSTRGEHGFNELLTLYHSLTTIGPILSYRMGSLHVGAGPAAGHIVVHSDEGEENKGKVTFGAVADMGLTFPRRSRLFLESRGQYRWIRGTEVGPFTSDDGSILRAFEIDMSHALVTVGLGARF